MREAFSASEIRKKNRLPVIAPPPARLLLLRTVLPLRLSPLGTVTCGEQRIMMRDGEIRRYIRITC